MRSAVLSVGLFLIVAMSACGETSKSSLAVQVAVGESHACAALADGSVRCWGTWEQGQRGLGVRLKDWPRDWLRFGLRVNEKSLLKPNRVVNLTDVVEVVAGEVHACARRKDGTVWCWGPQSQLGTTPRLSHWVRSQPYPQQVDHITDAVQLAAGQGFTYARRGDGSVWWWSGARYGDGHSPVQMPGVQDALEVRVGKGAVCVLLSDGSVICSGKGMVGAVNTEIIDTPLVIPQKNMTSLSLGLERACARSAEGKVSCWGSEGPKRVPEGLLLRAVATQQNTCGVTEGGETWCWGQASALRAMLPGTQIPGTPDKVRLGSFPGASEIVLGTSHLCLRLESGTVQCWGASWRDTEKERTPVAPGPFSVQGLGKATAIAAGSSRTCAASDDGRVRCWGQQRKLEKVEGITEATQVSVGENHACALRTNGTVTCWGTGDRGQLGRGLSQGGTKQPADTVPGLGSVEQVVAANAATCARLRSGGVRCWGNNTEGELGQGYFSRSGPKSAIGNPLVVQLPRPAVDLQAARNSFCASLSDGSLACWGRNIFHQFTSKDDAKREAITRVPGVSDAVQIAVSNEHACVRTKAGKVLCWGSNENGQMGDGTWGKGRTRPEPGEVTALAGATELFVSDGATCGRMAGGRVMCVGGESATLWELSGLQSASQVALRQSLYSYSRGPGEPERPLGCAVMNNGALACWGAVLPRSGDEWKRVGRPVQVRW